MEADMDMVIITITEVVIADNIYKGSFLMDLYIFSSTSRAHQPQAAPPLFPSWYFTKEKLFKALMKHLLYPMEHRVILKLNRF
jgi:hypothetical protein